MSMNPVNSYPFITRPASLTSFGSVADYCQNHATSVQNELVDHALRLNSALVKNGTEGMSAPLPLAVYTVVTLPTAASYAGGLIAVSNEAGGYTLAFSDGTNWRRVQDRAVVS